jgi:hypothetical protein
MTAENERSDQSDAHKRSLAKQRQPGMIRALFVPGPHSLLPRGMQARRSRRLDNCRNCLLHPVCAFRLAGQTKSLESQCERRPITQFDANRLFLVSAK